MSLKSPTIVGGAFFISYINICSKNVAKIVKKCQNEGMVSLALLLFIFVLLFSYIIFLFSKRLVYKLNKRVLARNLAIIKNGESLAHFNSLDEETKRAKIIIPFFQVLGYNTYDMREFRVFSKRQSFLPDYVTKKWDNSHLCKRSMYIKYENFSESAVDLKKNIYHDDRIQGACIDELMDKTYFLGECYVLTNGYLYLFFDKNYKEGSNKFKFCFNLKDYDKKSVAQLAYYTKQYMFLQIEDVYRA